MRELLLLSGGVDSIALAAWRRPELCLTIDYGQKAAAAEVQASAQVCEALKLDHLVVSAAIPHLGSGRMAGDENSAHSPHSEFWPFRNQYLVTLAAMVAIKRGLEKVLIGTVSTDKRHRDGSPEFLHSMKAVLLLQEGSIDLQAPSSDLTSDELVRESGVPESVIAWAHSCHSASLACGDCPGCYKHSSVMSALGFSR